MALLENQFGAAIAFINGEATKFNGGEMKGQRAIVLLGMMLLGVSIAFADDIVYNEVVYTDPATLQVPGTTLDPVQIGSNNVAVFQNQGGAGPLNDPWLLILGVPNTNNPTLFDKNSIASVTSSAGGNTSWTYGGYKTSITGSPKGQDAYSALFPTSNLDNSNSFVNWAGADSTINHIHATSFGLYEFNINAFLGSKDTVAIDFATLPVGTFVIAYGETSKTTSSRTCTGTGKNKVCTTTNTTTITQFDTPFTEAGLRTGTPEPAGILLLGSGVLGLLGFRRVRR